ncbi:Uma2 family endonuclease [Streptomyces sannanensis]|uniref:Uma2 family endonuclease n=1 Tax=Streptomyces sannanensis TaxID=285536 RepID=A0ABP6SF36_9ACTN
MTATLPEADVAAAEHKSLREVAHELPVPEGFRVEIIGGVIIVSPSPTGKHGRVVWRLVDMLLPKLPEGYGIETNLGVDKRAGADDYAIPDLFVAPEEVLDTASTEILPEAVILVAEVVSQSSQTTDRVAKLKQYAESGIPVYLLVDPHAGEITVFSDPAMATGEYRARHTVPWGDILALPGPLGAEIDSACFPSLQGWTRP